MFSKEANRMQFQYNMKILRTHQRARGRSCNLLIPHDPYSCGGNVLGGIQRGPNWYFQTPCPGNPRDELTLLRLIQQCVLPRTTIIADGWKSNINQGLHGPQLLFSRKQQLLDYYLFGFCSNGVLLY